MGWDRNGDGIVTITDVLKVLGEVWILSTMLPFLAIEAVFVNYIPEVSRFLEIERIIPAMGVWSVFVGLATWAAIAIAAAFLEDAVRRRLNRSTTN